MLLYLVKLTHKKTGKVFYKRGKSKWGQYNVIEKRFRADPAYDIFDIELLAHIQLSRTKLHDANLIINTVEQVLNGQWEPKDRDFNVEQYLGENDGTLDSCGVTEFIFLKEDETEDMLVMHFKTAEKYLWKVK